MYPCRSITNIYLKFQKAQKFKQLGAIWLRVRNWLIAKQNLVDPNYSHFHYKLCYELVGQICFPRFMLICNAKWYYGNIYNLNLPIAIWTVLIFKEPQSSIFIMFGEYKICESSFSELVKLINFKNRPRCTDNHVDWRLFAFCN